MSEGGAADRSLPLAGSGPAGDSPPAPTLVFACGNPSRGDDALGPACMDGLAEWLPRTARAAAVDLLLDFQLQIEHALDLQGRQRVLFVDAAVDLDRPCRLASLRPRRDHSFTSHAMSPAAVLAVYRDLFGAPPASYVLRLRGRDFELGQGLSPIGRESLATGLALAKQLCERPDDAYWREKCGA